MVRNQISLLITFEIENNKLKILSVIKIKLKWSVHQLCYKKLKC